MEVQIKAVAVERSGEKVAARRRVVSRKGLCDLLVRGKRRSLRWIQVSSSESRVAGGAVH